jgi:DNA-binding NarL/FixJ family response regulator
MIRVAVVDDHPIFRAGMSRAIETIPECVLVGDADSVERVLPVIARGVDVIVLDLGLPGLSGAAAVEHLCALGHRVLVVSASSAQGDVVAAIGAGASGYLTKSAPPEEIVLAVETVHRGGTYISPTLAAYLLQANRDADAAADFALTPREREILSLVASGERDADIAEQLFISVSTVGSHLDRIRDKTGRRRRAELTRLAIEQGLVEPDA